MKKIAASIAATLALTGALLVAPTVDLTHDHVDNAPATAAAHDMPENCTHSTKRTTWWTAVFVAHFTNSSGRHFHYYQHQHNVFLWNDHYVYTDCTWAH